MLITELGYPTTEEEMKGRFYNVDQHPDYQTFVAVVDTMVVGMIGLIKNFFYEKNGTYIRIGALVVNLKFRNRQIGRQLIRKAEEWAIETGSEYIYLNSGNREERKDAHVFYQRMGFEARTVGFVKLLKSSPSAPE